MAADLQPHQGNLSDSGTAVYTSQGQSGAGAVNLTSGESATFWVRSARDGYADLTFRFRDTGRADLSVSGRTVDDQILSGATTGAWSTSANRDYLATGINKVKVTGTSGTLAVTPFSAGDAVTTGNAVTYQAENGTLTGTAAADTTYSQADGGVVTGIGDGPANSLTLSVNAPSAGTYAMTMRYANGEKKTVSRGNPDISAMSGLSSTAVAQHSSLCLEDPARSTTDGTQYQQNACGSGQEQVFDFHPVSGATDTYTVVNHSSGKCLDISAYSTANGAAVQ